MRKLSNEISHLCEIANDFNCGQIFTKMNSKLKCKLMTGGGMQKKLKLNTRFHLSN